MRLGTTLTLATSLAFVCSGALPAAAYDLPNARLTPGAVGTSDGAVATAADICVPGYARRTRHPFDAAWRRDPCVHAARCALRSALCAAIDEEARTLY